MTIKVLLVDDHAMFRQGVRQILKSQADIEVVGEAQNGEEGIAMVAELQPDVVVMDVHMPIMDGVRATRAIMEAADPPAIIILTMSKHDDYVFEAIKHGARGYYLKDSDASELMDAIRQVAVGEMILSSEMAQRVLREFRHISTTGEVKRGLAGLDDREIEIMRLVAAGTTNQQIAEILHLSEKTIKNQLSTIFRKLSLDNRTQAAIYALRHGLVTLEEL